jgi:hypothetical protein
VLVVAEDVDECAKCCKSDCAEVDSVIPLVIAESVVVGEDGGCIQ